MKKERKLIYNPSNWNARGTKATPHTHSSTMNKQQQMKAQPQENIKSSNQYAKERGTKSNVCI